MGQLMLCWGWERVPLCWDVWGCPAALGLVCLVLGQQELGCSRFQPCWCPWPAPHPLPALPLFPPSRHLSGGCSLLLSISATERLPLTSPQGWDLLPSSY